MLEECVDYCVDELGDHSPLQGCNPWLKGGNRNAIVLLCGHGITDPSNAVQVQAAIDAGTAKKITNAKFWIDAASEVTQTAPIACAPETITNYTRTGGFYDPNISSANTSFYDSLLGGINVVGVLIFSCGNPSTPQVKWVNAETSFRGGYVSPETDDDFERYEGTLNWKSLNNPSIHTAPAGIF